MATERASSSSILAYLRDGPVEVRFVKPDLGKAGFTVRTAEQASKALGVQLRRESEDGCNNCSWEVGGVAEAAHDAD
jgi:hypothetical protein